MQDKKLAIYLLEAKRRKTSHWMWALVTLLTAGWGAIGWIWATCATNSHNRKLDSTINAIAQDA